MGGYGPGGYGQGGYGIGGHCFGRGMPWGGILFCIIAVIGIIFLVRYFSKKVDKSPDHDNAQLPVVQSASALALLDERYAKGEIDQQDYLKMKKDILSDKV